MSERDLKPFIVPIFIPHHGCPHRCIFCEQERITSRSAGAVSAQDVRKTLDTAVASRGFDPERNPEIAFYGGTFTRLPFDKMTELLNATEPYIRQGLFKTIRVSTRPDALADRRLDTLKYYHVETVELGVQSMDDKVLSLTNRGHGSSDTINAFEKLKDAGFRVGMQLMPGLPGDSAEGFFETVEKVVALKPDMVRIYPALVIKGTEMAEWYENGRYKPLELKEAVDLCSKACMRIEAEGIPVIRIGLMSSPSLLEKGQILGGPWHCAFGFLVRSEIFRVRMAGSLPGPGKASEIMIYANKRDIPLIRGYKNEGMKWIEMKSGARVSDVREGSAISRGTIRVECL